MKISESKIRKIVRALINEINDQNYEFDNLEDSNLIDDERFESDSYVDDLIRSLEQAQAVKVGPSADWIDVAYRYGNTVVVLDVAEQEVALLDTTRYERDESGNKVFEETLIPFGTPVSDIMSMIS